MPVDNFFNWLFFSLFVKSVYFLKSMNHSEKGFVKQ